MLIQEAKLRIGQMERQLAEIDVALEAACQERDAAKRDLGAMTRERDRTLAALSQPTHELLSELTQALAALDGARCGRDEKLLEAIARAGEAEARAGGFKDQNHQLRTELEQVRVALRKAEERNAELYRDLQLARARADDVAQGIEPESDLLRVMSARQRAIEVAAAAEEAAEASSYKEAQAYAAVAQAWAAIAILPKKRSNDE
jgi:hypothetical protein